jgi:uncharacterized protein YndB with AHSA1/START domain
MKHFTVLLLLVGLARFTGLAHAQQAENSTNKINTMKTFHIVATINAPVACCWNAWTDVEVANQWLGATSIGTKVDDDYRVSNTIPYLSGRHKILELVANKSLNYSCTIGTAGRKWLRSLGH